MLAYKFIFPTYRHLTIHMNDVILQVNVVNLDRLVPLAAMDAVGKQDRPVLRDHLDCRDLRDQWVNLVNVAHVDRLDRLLMVNAVLEDKQ